MQARSLWGAGSLIEVMQDGPLKFTVIGRSSSTQLVNDYERVLGSRLNVVTSHVSSPKLSATNAIYTHFENCCSLQHLRHKCRDSLKLAISCSHSCKNAVKDGQLSFRSRYEGPDLSQKGNATDLMRKAKH